MTGMILRGVFAVFLLVLVGAYVFEDRLRR
jgi:hypothetical protein